MLADILRVQSGQPSRGSADIAVIGMACRIAPGGDLNDFWSRLVAGADLIADFPATRREDIDPLIQLLDTSPAGLSCSYYQAAFLEQIDLFDHAAFNIPPGEARLIDPQQRLMLEVVLECIENAGYRREQLSGTKTGVYMAYAEPEYDRLAPPDEPSSVHATLPAMIAGRVSYAFNLSGPSQVIETTCSSSLIAVHNACLGIMAGDCDVALAGGVRLMLFPLAEGFTTIPQGISSPDGRTRAFDAEGNGAGSGEGAGVVLLKPLRKAIEDRDHIYAIVKGSAVNSDGKSSGVTAPNPRAQTQVVVDAWKRAGIAPETISYIEAHGTATKLGDPIEVEGLTNAFRQYTDRKAMCAIGSVKTNIGHLSGAAGIASFIKVVLALKYRQLPPSLHYNKPNPLIDFDNTPLYVNRALRPWDWTDGPRHAGVSAFGITGSNCHVVLEEYVDPERGDAGPADAGKLEVFTLSADSQAGMRQLLDKYVRFLSSTHAHTHGLERICYTANTGRETYAHRLAITARSVAELRERVEQAARQYAQQPSSPPVGEGIFFGMVDRRGEPVAWQMNAPRTAGELARLFVQMPRVNWDAFYADRALTKAPLPTYPFNGKRCWVSFEEIQQAFKTKLSVDRGLPSPGSSTLPAERRADPDAVDTSGWLYRLRWQPEPRGAIEAGDVARGLWLILADDLGIGHALADRLATAGREAVLVRPGARFVRHADSSYEIAPKDQADWERLLANLSERGQTPLAGVIHLWTCQTPMELRQPDEQYVEQQDTGAFSMFALLQQLDKFQARAPLDVWIVANYVAAVTEEEPFLFPGKASLWGLAKVIPQEHYWAQCYCVDVATQDAAPADLAGEIFAEMRLPATGRDHVVAYRRQNRFIQQIERLDLGQVADRAQPVVRQGGVYLLAGGAGRIGMGIGMYFARQARVTVIMVNRSALPPRAEWPAIVASGSADSKIAQRLIGIDAIERLGSCVDYFAADIGDSAAMGRIVETILARYGRLDGVINLTMDIKYQKLSDTVQADFERSVLNRIRGALALDRATRQAKLDFLIVCSSVSSTFGGVTFADHAAANRFLDAQGEFIRKSGRDVMVLNLPTIQYQRSASTSHAEMVIPSITGDDLANLFDRLIQKRIAFVMIADFDFVQIKSLLPVLRVRFASSLLEEHPERQRPDTQRRGASAPPRARLKSSGGQASYTETELRLAEAWMKVLGYEEFDVDDNFFALGADSLIAMRLIGEIHKALGVKLEIVDVYTNPTIRAIASQIEARNGGGRPADSPRAAAPPIDHADSAPAQPALPLRPIPRDQNLPLSFAQQRLWLLEQLQPGNPANNLSAALKIAGRLDLAIFSASLNTIVERHEILRATFAVVDGSPVHHIAPKLEIRPTIVNLRGLSEPGQSANVLQIAVADARQPFDLANGPLLRATVIELGEEEHVVVLTTHHIVSDGQSMGVFLRELATIYSAHVSAEPAALPALPIQYADFAYWQRHRLHGQALDKLINYWRERLADAPVIELPTDYPRPTTLTFEGANHRFCLSGELSAQLRELSQHEQATIFVTMLAAFLALLRLYTSQDDLVIGAFSAHRDRPETQHLIGLFANIMVMRVDLSGHPTFRDLLVRVREVVMESSSYQALTYEQVLEAVQPKRSANRLPLVQVALNYFADPMQGVAFKDLTMTLMDVDRGAARYDLVLDITDAGDEGIVGIFEYNTNLFKPATIAQMARRLETFLRRVASTPTIQI